MQTVIEDALGLKSCIKIKNVSTFVNADLDYITIYGEMCARPEVSAMFNLEPEICCNLIDDQEQINYSTVSTHADCFWATRCSTFKIHIKDFSKKCESKCIQKIVLRLIWKKYQSLN